MPNCREQFLEKTLIYIADSGIENLNLVKMALVNTLDNYEIQERCTELALRDDNNEKLLERFLVSKRICGGSDRTAKNRWYTLTDFVRKINKPLNEVDSVDIQVWLYQQEQRGIALQTVNSYRGTLASFFSWLKKNKLIAEDPTELVPVIKHPNVIVTSFSPVEIDALKNACKTKEEKAMIYLLFSSGIRCEELVDLRWKDINFTNNDVLIVEGKGRKSRVTIMDDVTSVHLKAHKDSMKYKSEYVFPRMYRKEVSQKTTKAIWCKVKDIAERANVENVHPHRFRHTFATERYRHGMDVHMIQLLMGHSTVNTTLRYIDSDLESIREAYKRSV